MKDVEYIIYSYSDSSSKVTHLVVEQPPLHIVRDNPGLSDKYFNPGLKFNRNSLGGQKKGNFRQYLVGGV